MEIGFFHFSDFIGDFEDSKSTSGGIFCIRGSRSFGLMCKRQMAVSHSLRECEVISMDHVLRMDGISSWYLRDLDVDIMHSSPNTGGTEKPDAMCSQCEMSPKTRTKLNPPLLKEICLREIDHVDPNRKLSHHGVPTYFFEDKQLKKQISKGRSPTMRHGSRTHSYLTQLILIPHVSEIRRYPKPICRTCDRMNIHSC